MKTIIYVCLLSIGLLFPATKANSSTVKAARIITVHIEGWNLYANSELKDGLIQRINIVNLSTGSVVRKQSCSSYSCSISIAGLPTGGYVAVVTCQYASYSKQFKIA